MKGIKGIYTGLPMQAMSDIPSYAVYFAVYDFLKKKGGFLNDMVK